MPPTPIPVNYGIAVAKMSLIATGEVMVTTWGFHNTPMDNADVVAATLSGNWQDNFTAATTIDQYQYDGLYVTVNLGGTHQSAQTVDNIPGTVNAEPVSPAVAVRVTKQTLLTGRANRGRMYLQPAFLPEINVNAAGVIDFATKSSLDGQTSGLFTDVDTAGYPMYILHADLSTPTQVNGLLVRNTVGTQRRRQTIS